MPRISFPTLALLGLSVLGILGGFGLSARSGGLDPYALVCFALGLAAGALALSRLRRPTTAARSLHILAAAGASAVLPNPRASFGAGIVRFIRLEPVRTAMIIRIAFYLVTAVVYGTVIDPEFLLESLLTAVLGSAADLAKSEDTRARAVPAVVDYELGKLSAAGEIGVFAANLLRSLVPSFVGGATLARALEIALPLLSTIAGQPLTQDAQRAVTVMLHDALRQAGIIRRVDMPETGGAA